MVKRLRWPIRLVAPHRWAIGHTFEFTFSLPEPANKCGGSPTRKNPAGTGKSLKKAAPRATKPKQRTAPDPVQTEAKRQNQVEYDRQRNKSPERVEYKRLYAQKRPHRARELGKCRNCSKPAIPGQSRCETCAEQHRQSRRRSDAKRRAAAKAMPAAERQATLPLTQGSWETTKRDWPNPKSIEHARPGSQQNLSFLKGPHHD